MTSALDPFVSLVRATESASTQPTDRISDAQSPAEQSNAGLHGEQAVDGQLRGEKIVNERLRGEKIVHGRLRGEKIVNERLRVNEIFFSLQGETSRVGLPTVFVRLTGCPLRCGYCDTAYAFHEGTAKSFGQILAAVAAYRAHYVTVTGGEPLAQKDCPKLLEALCDAGYSVSLETSGAVDIGGIDSRVSRILDIKTPGSGEVDKNRWDNLDLLTAHDEVKFVLCDAADYAWAVEILQRQRVADRCPVLFAPVHDTLNATQLAEWILRDRLSVRMQVQLHKYLWGDVPGH